MATLPSSPGCVNPVDACSCALPGRGEPGIPLGHRKELKRPTQGGKEAACGAGQGGKAAAPSSSPQRRDPAPGNAAHRLPGRPTAWDLTAAFRDDLF